ncbi:hypothetical protein CWO91_13970 [Bradyrhizobium genosp. SA-3]|uniref:hypothetical protein n=1 Tax=Bradyrhizobium genosp. SA-3 TaxID=508868 RepID=UPI00102A6DC2|nr:hypothetical protein [Bradyrhizobium genosp. SA-3]RZN10295.1 hypothetical protein CWO91_13970 [Bradyrhizobium genosp. SA-3]
MSEVINFPRRQEPFAPHPAVLRIQGLTILLAELHGASLRTQDDMRRALWILDLTNRSVQLILSDFKDDPNIQELIRQAEELTASVEEARRMVQHLDAPALHKAAALRK